LIRCRKYGRIAEQSDGHAQPLAIPSEKAADPPGAAPGVEDP